MPRSRALPARLIAPCAALALAALAAGCAKGSFNTDSTPSLNLKETFAVPDWAKPAETQSKKFADEKPVAPEDLVGADGRCAAEAEASAPAAPPPQNPPPAAPPAQTAAAPSDHLEIGGGAGGFVPPNAALLGGIALGMTECQTVRRAGMPSNIVIGADDKAERTVTLTYLEGTWPGIYRFRSGRLREIDRAPAPPTPPKPEKKKPAKKPVKKKPQVAKKPVEREYLQ